MRGALRPAGAVVRDALVLGSLSFLCAKALTLVYIGANSFLFGRETPLLVLYSNLGRAWTSAELMAPLVLSPLTETLIFGAVWVIWKRTKLGALWLLLPSAALFAAYHLIIPGPHFYRVSVAFVGGLFLAEAFRRNGMRFNGVTGFAACALTHSCYNGFIAVV
jgi:hypothetical protein